MVNSQSPVTSNALQEGMAKWIMSLYSLRGLVMIEEDLIDN